jgi:hypothetical protein
VQIVQRFVLARLRNRRFFSLVELNAAIHECVDDLNGKIMRKLGVSRNELFAEIDRSALKALPSAPYQYAEWKKCRVAPDYHVEIADHYYSVPSRLIREELDAETGTEALLGMRLGVHDRLEERYRGGTDLLGLTHHPGGSPFGVSPVRARHVFGDCGVAMPRMRADMAGDADALVQNLDRGVGDARLILRLARSYGSARIEAACRRGNDIGATSYGSIKSILQHGLDQAYANDAPPQAPPIHHRNIRGNGYYH